MMFNRVIAIITPVAMLFTRLKMDTNLIYYVESTLILSPNPYKITWEVVRAKLRCFTNTIKSISDIEVFFTLTKVLHHHFFTY